MFSLFFGHLTLIRIIKRGIRWIVPLPKYFNLKSSHGQFAVPLDAWAPRSRALLL